MICKLHVNLPGRIKLEKGIQKYHNQDTVDGKNPVNQLRLVVITFLTGFFIHARWLCGIFFHQQYLHDVDQSFLALGRPIPVK